ncbi:hypothetical protein Tco_0201330 [Tanacetum coccineum]
MSSASSAVTYTSVYTDFEPGRVFWEADDEEISDRVIPRVIVYRYDGLPMQPVAPLSPDYIPGPEDELEEQPLPPVDSPTAESPGYVTESDPEEDPEEYEDDETEDVPVDYPMDGGDDDDGDSSGDDADDEDEDEVEEEDEEEHPTLADSAVVIPTASISLPPEAEVERLLAMPTPPPSPLTSLSPPSARERLTRIASTQALIDVVTAALPSPLLPPLPPSLYIPPPVNCRDDLPEFELPPRKRLCLSTLGSSTVDVEARRQGISEVRYGIRDTWVDLEEAVPEIAPMTVGEVNTKVTELAELHEHDTQDLYALLEDAQDDRRGGGLCFPRGLGSLDRIESGDPSGVSDLPRQAQMAETLRVIRDMRQEMSDMQAELLAHREQQRRAR